MSDLNERDASSLRDMLENARIARTFMDGKTKDDLETDLLLAYGVVRALEIIGEAAHRITPETREDLSSIEWLNIIGMRNRLIHGYDNINNDIVWTVVQEDLVPLITILLPALQQIYSDLP